MLQFLFSFQIVINHFVYSEGPAEILYLALQFGVEFPVRILGRKGEAKLKMESFCCRSLWMGRGQVQHDLEFIMAAGVA